MKETDNDVLEKCSKLEQLGIQMPVEYMPNEEQGIREQTYCEELASFLKSMEFMKLGQAIAHKQWQTAAMSQQRMEKKAQLLGLTCFQRPLAGIRQNILRRNEVSAKQALALIVGKRVQILERLKSGKQ